jgi:cell division septation protein DedD
VYLRLPVAFVISFTTIFLGCGTTEETPSPPAQVSQPEPPPPPKAFESRTDTVSAVHTVAGQRDSASAAQPHSRWLVQIGAFKDPLLANASQASARQRYAMTVLNDYNPLVGLYQIRIGFFETKDLAQAFRERMQKEFPEEYKGAWVVEFKQ